MSDDEPRSKRKKNGSEIGGRKYLVSFLAEFTRLQRLPHLAPSYLLNTIARMQPILYAWSHKQWPPIEAMGRRWQTGKGTSKLVKKRAASF